MAIERSKVRHDFCKTYGNNCQNVHRHCFEPDSSFLRQFLVFFNAQNAADFIILVETCRLLHKFALTTGDIVSLFSGVDYSSERNLVDFRVKKLAFACIEAIHQNRNRLSDQLLVTPEEANISTAILMEAMSLLLDPKLPWACKIVSYLQRRNIFKLFREIVITAKEQRPRGQTLTGSIVSLERVLILIVPHVGREPCCCPAVDSRWSFSSMILTVPLIWQLFPRLKLDTCVLPIDTSTEFPSYACLLGNTLETANVVPEFSLDMAIDIASVATFLMEKLPPVKSSERESRQRSSDEDDMLIDDVPEFGLNRNLEQQITIAIDSRFLLQITEVLFHQVSLGTTQAYDEDKEALAIGTASSFLYAAFNILPLERIMTILAYRTELVAVLWNYMKRCHENQKWSSMPKLLACLPEDPPGWLHMLMILDNEEFYEREKPLSLQDIRHYSQAGFVFSYGCVVAVALWRLLWVNPLTQPNTGKYLSNDLSKKNRVDLIQNRVGLVVSELLSHLQDWNNRLQFTSSSDFQADTVNELFISLAIMKATRANYILMQAPFLIPFTSRVKIFTTQLATARQSHGYQGIFARKPFRIRRDHILEDAYNQMNALSEDEFRESIRVTFVNELGVAVTGIDGGGIFKDFMEKITQAAFDVQYGLFKVETVDHMLYPNPGSGMIHEQHLQFFHFLGRLLAKAMFEGILIDIPFATFFLSKLKQKYNYLNDLPSLDPELYRHLIFLKVLISGSVESLDIDDLRSNSSYTGGYHIGHSVIDMFWEVIKSFSTENQKKLLNCSRGPLLGFKYLKPSFCILRDAGNDSVDGLPTSIACLNLLKLLPYQSKELLETKLMYAISADAGFDMS
ncbi:unnamed protein product [Arabis nemorensis]|uniref:HECT-type E3 ubiquitin transferase n=1 Tax=Arabis nemorensis TaxID=586526 RepID=A0A565BGB2_9BRAS|nr:unnamed protein product [Arabis nemorensis]